MVNHRTYDAFGNLTAETNSSVDLAFGFTGKFFDEVSQLSHHWNRWYDPKLGKWLSEDPIGFAGGDANLGRYVGNGATSHRDPSGLFRQDPVIIVRMADGSIREFAVGTDPEVIRRLGGEIVEGQVPGVDGTGFQGATGMLEVQAGLQTLLAELREKREISQLEHEVLVDLTQAALDVGGCVEPTPFCDAGSGVLSLYKGEIIAASMSLVGIIPYLGDAVKIPGKVPSIVRSVGRAIDLATLSPKLAEKIRPLLTKLSGAIDYLTKMNLLPDWALKDDSLGGLKKKN